MGEEAKQEEAKAETQPEEKAEEKKEDKPAEEKKEEETPPPPPPPPPPIVLFVDLHCVGCAKRVERCMMKFKGVEGVDIDMSKNQVTVKGILDPQALCMRIQNKTKRKARVLSPLPTVEGETIKPEIVTSQVSGVTTIELNVNMHCEACAQQLKSKILKMRGVQSAETELSSGKVTVTGTMDAGRLVDYVYRHTRKQAKIVPQPTEQKEEGGKEGEKPAEEAAKEEPAEEKKEEEKAPEQGGKNNENKEEKAAEGGEEVKKEGEEVINSMEEVAKKMMYWQSVYVIERVPPPQLFSDENPNACCIS
ncbi:hypothetical protein AAC387_Pa06g0426 [Persea americana]